MKKSLFILAAASAVAFAACNGGNNEGSYTQEQVDSMAAAMKDSASAAMKASADSAIQAQADAAARSADSIRVIDSIVAATKASSTKTTVVRQTGGGKTTTTTKTEQVTEEPSRVSPSSIDKKAARFGDDAAKAKVQQSSTDAKADRFKK